MATESMAPTVKDKQIKANRIKLAVGEKWATSEDAEVVRLREGSVDEAGMRHIEFVKDESGANNRQQCMNYRKLGYEVRDMGDYYDCVISQEQYLVNKKTLVEDPAFARVQRKAKHKDARSGMDEEFTEQSEAVSSKDVLGL